MSRDDVNSPETTYGPHRPIVGCLLAGGRSSRMGGGQKFRRAVGGVPIVERVRQRILPQVDELIVSAREPGLEDLRLPVVFDFIPDAGPLAGIDAALDWAGTTYGQECLLLTVSTDTPFLPNDLAARLLETLRKGDAEIATAQSLSGTHPTISLWSASLRSSLRAWLKQQPNRSVGAFIRTQRAITALFEGPVDRFFNINHPADQEEAEALLRLYPELGA